MTVYIASIDVALLPGAVVRGRGATVDVYIPETSAEAAVRRLLLALTEDNYELIAIDGLRPFDEVEWSTDDDEREAAELVREATESGDVVYSVFYSWDEEYEH